MQVAEQAAASGRAATRSLKCGSPMNSILVECDDPSRPLTPKRFEEFVMAVFRDGNVQQAYLDSIDGRVNVGVASRKGQDLIDRVTMKRRLEYLNERKKGMGKDLDIGSIVQKLAVIVQEGSSSELLKTVPMYLELKKQRDLEMIGGLRDPALVADALAGLERGAEGMVNSEKDRVVMEVIRKLAEMMRVDDVSSMLRRIVAGMNAGEIGAVIPMAPECGDSVSVEILLGLDETNTQKG